jgi:hypothetical protein
LSILSDLPLQRKLRKLFTFLTFETELKLGKEYTLVILLSAWGRSRDSKAKRNLSKQMWRILEPFGQVLVTIFLYFNLKTTTFFTNNICRIHTTWTGQICLRFGSFQDKLDCPDGMVSIQQIIFGEKKCTKLQFWYIIKSVLVLNPYLIMVLLPILSNKLPCSRPSLSMRNSVLLFNVIKL